MNLLISDSHKDRIADINSWFLMALIFFVPISTAGQNIFAFLILIFFLIEGRFREKWLKLKSQPLFWAFLAYILIYPISLIWTDNIEWGLEIFKKHFKYIWFPILLTVVRKEHFYHYVGAFILAISFSEVVSYAVFFELIQVQGIDPNFPAPFYGHIPYNPLLAFAIFILLDKLLYGEMSLVKKILIITFILTMVVNMFITGGRAGQIVFIILIISLVAYYSYQKGYLLKGLLVSVPSMFLILTLAYSQSSLFHERVNLAAEEIANYDSNSQGSVSWRIHFVLNSMEIIQQEPLFGVGIGDFPDEYAKINAVNTPESPSTVQPHNQYVFEFASLGLIGLMILLSIFVLMIKEWLRCGDRRKNLQMGFIILFLVIMWSDTYLLGRVTSLFFIVMAAVLFSRDMKLNESKKLVDN